MVLTRRGGFRRAGRGGPQFVDPTLAYLTVPGEEECFAHPNGGDDCTSLHLSERLWRELFAERRLRRRGAAGPAGRRGHRPG
ncbi:AraC family transcriptional regulator, partial [Micromonospora globispora]